MCQEGGARRRQTDNNTGFRAVQSRPPHPLVMQPPEEKSRPSPESATSEVILRHLLRDARKQRGLSQMELALRLGFSPRHISFVEVGRSRPSRTVMERWLDEVEARPSVRSAALLHAGFALKSNPANDRTGDPARHPASELFERLLSVHEPFPAFLFDADWRIRSANRGARWLMSVVMPEYLESLPPSAHVDMIEACAHPSGLLSQMVGAQSVGYALLAQLELETSANPRLRPRVENFASSLTRRFGGCNTSGPASFAHLTFSFATDSGHFDFFRFQSLVDLPQDVTLHSLRVEVGLALNDHTKEAMRKASLTFPRQLDGP